MFFSCENALLQNIVESQYHHMENSVVCTVLTTHVRSLRLSIVEYDSTSMGDRTGTYFSLFSLFLVNYKTVSKHLIRY